MIRLMILVVLYHVFVSFNIMLVSCCQKTLLGVDIPVVVDIILLRRLSGLLSNWSRGRLFTLLFGIVKMSTFCVI